MTWHKTCLFLASISLCFLVTACTRDTSRAKEQAALRELAPNKPVTDEVAGKVVTLVFGIGVPTPKPLSDVELELIAHNFPSLEYLSLGYEDGGITAKGISSLRNLKALRSLMIPTYLKPEAIEALAGLENITQILVNHIPDKELQAIAKMLRLANLSISSDNITDQGLLALGKCKTLNHLSLCDLDKVTPDGLDALKNCKNLESIFLGKRFRTQEEGCDFQFLDNPKMLPKLREISLAGIPISPAGFEQIGKKTTLDTLFFFACDITPKELEELTKIDRLEKLRVVSNQTAVDVDFVQEILQFKNLKTLDLRNTDITDAAMAQIQKHYEESDLQSEEKLFLKR